MQDAFTSSLTYLLLGVHLYLVSESERIFDRNLLPNRGPTSNQFFCFKISGNE